MYRDGIELLTHDKVNFVFNHGALGDVICSLPAVIVARATHNAALKMIVWAPEYLLDLVSTLLHPYGDFEYRRFEDFPMKASERNVEEDGPVAINAIHSQQYTRNRVSLVDYAFAPLLDAQPVDDTHRSYPNAAPLGPRKIPGQYIVFPVGATSDNKLFHPDVLEPVIMWALGEGYQPVILGKSTTQMHALGADGQVMKLHIRYGYDSLPEDLKAQCLDLRDQLTLIEARNVCGYAAAVVGVDGGTIHLAGTTDVPIVYGLTTTIPEHRAIVRNGKNNWRVRHVTPKDLECAGCQSKWTLMFRQDFRFCAYGDNKCVTSLRGGDFISAIIDVIRTKND